MVTGILSFAGNPLAAYLPQIQLASISARGHAPTEPWHKRCAGSILLIDITGFTELAEQFAAKGAASVEELSQVLSAYFGRMADVITAHGGDILTFAGDAALALWLAESEEELPTSAGRAAQAALVVQKDLLGHTLPGNAVLRQRAAVGAGSLATMEVGGADGHWQFLVAGTAIQQAGEGSQRANSGDVIVSPAAWNFLKSGCTGDALSDGFVKLGTLHEALRPVPFVSSSNLVSVSALRSYVLPVVVNRLRAGQGAWLAEFRNVTVLFIHLEDPHWANVEGEISGFCRGLHDAVGKMQEILFRHEGCVYQFLMDDKGIVLVGAFGLGPPAHEDDPVRAVKSALAIHEELERIGVRASIGISTGRAFCGVIGSESRRQYTAVGPVMNMSARLMQSAAGRILCDQGTNRVCQSRPELSLESLGEIKVKGRSERLAVYLPGKALAPEESGVVGRETERAVLARALESLVQDRRGSTIVLEGEPGIGKSRLVEYIIERARKLNVACLMGTGDPVEGSSAYHAWQAVLRTLFRVDALASPQIQAQRIAAAMEVQPGIRQLLPLLATVLPLSFPDNEVTAQMTGKVRAENTQELLFQLLKGAASSAPHLLIVEDAHWLDPSSLALLAMVVQRSQSLLVVITTRPFSDSVPSEFQLIRTAAGERYLRLDTLPRDESLEIVRRQLGIKSLPRSVEDFLQARAGGQPFFIQELAFALRDAGLIQIANGQCRVAGNLDDSPETLERAFGALNIPSSIQGVITSRVDCLPAPQQLTLKVASVIGKSFSLFVVQEVYPQTDERPDIPDHLAHLEKAALTRRLPSLELMEEFRHALIQEVVYVSISFANRRELHQAIAEWYEQRYQQDLAPYYPLLAYHWRHAEVMAKALDYSVRAGAQALQNFANREAVGFLRDAIELSGHQQSEAADASEQQLALCRLWLGKAQVNLSDYVDGRVNLEGGLAALRQSVPTSLMKSSKILLAELLRQSAHRRWPGHYVGRSFSDKERLLEAARAYEGLVEIYYLENAPLPTLAASIKSLNLAESAGPSPELARAYAAFGAILGFIPWHSAAASYCQRALKTAETVNDLSAIAWVLMCKGVYESGLGKWDEADADFQRMLEISQRLNDTRKIADAIVSRTMVRYFRGEFSESLRETEKLYALMLKDKDHILKAEALRWKAHNLLALGNLAALPACLAELEQLRSHETNKGVFNLADVYAIRARLHLHLGEYSEALAAVQGADNRAGNGSNASHELAVERAAIAEVYCTLTEQIQSGAWKPAGGNSLSNAAGVLRQCRAGAKRACVALRKFTRVFPMGAPLTWLHLGQYRYITDNSSKGIDAWNKAISSAKALRMPYTEAMAESALGRGLPKGAESRQEHLNRACTLFRALGTEYDLGVAEKALREAGIA